MVRKLGVVMAMTFFTTDASKANAAVFILALAVFHLGAKRPYRSPLHNRLAVLVLAATAGVLYGGTFVDYMLRRTVVMIGVLVNVLAIVVGNFLDIRLILRREAQLEIDEYYVGGTLKAVDDDATGTELGDLGSLARHRSRTMSDAAISLSANSLAADSDAVVVPKHIVISDPVVAVSASAAASASAPSESSSASSATS